MNAARFCPQCGTALLSTNASGICPRCAFQVAMQAEGPGNVHSTFQAGIGGHGHFVPPKPDQLAQQFPQLEILDLIGQGGMGAVYKARQRGLDRFVALKILPPDLARDPAFEERFAREARALAKLSHPNIVAVYDSGQVGGLFYFLMEFVDGVNLRQALQNGQLSAKEALAIVPQVCDALQYAHDEGIVHRDIKPENVLIDRKGRVKIADFGLARLLGKTADNFTLTGTQQVMGTPKYMAPEQLEGTHDVDHRADIYSLGVVFYEMLTGELPLGRFAPPSKKVQVDVRLDEVVLRILEKEPSLRYQQAGDIKTAVQLIYGATEVPQHLRHVYGREYRSKTHIFGVPLLHIATGIDPATHQRRIAKGIIAIGDQAIGVLAIGGAAFGLFAIGGMAVGGVTLGGLSIGLALALGGGAFGCGLAIGGFAMAPIAVGGCAIGYYATGGAAFGFHPYGANARDPAAQAFFRDSAATLLRLLPALSLSLLIVPVLVMLGIFAKAIAAMVTANQKPGAENFKKYPPSSDEQPSLHPAITAGCFALVVLGLLAIIPLGMVWYYVSLGSTQVELAKRAEAQARVAKPRAQVADSRVQPPTRQESLDWTDEGPSVSEKLQRVLNLSADRVDEVNQVLREAHSAYVELEQRHSRREEIDSRQITKVQVPAESIDKLQQQLWSRLAMVLDEGQMAKVKQQLAVVPPKRADPGSAISKTDSNELAVPGLLGWGSHNTEIDLLREGDTFDWEIHSQNVRVRGQSRGLDPRWKRFWLESK